MAGEPDQVSWRGVRPVEGIQGVWPARNAVRIYASGYAADDATHNFYTVPAGKRLFLTSGWLAVRMAAVASGWGGLGSWDELDANVYYFAIVYQVVVGSYNTALNWFPAMEFPAGHDIVVKSSLADLDACAIINGWLEDA